MKRIALLGEETSRFEGNPYALQEFCNTLIDDSSAVSFPSDRLEEDMISCQQLIQFATSTLRACTPHGKSVLSAYKAITPGSTPPAMASQGRASLPLSMTSGGGSDSPRPRGPRGMIWVGLERICPCMVITSCLVVAQQHQERLRDYY